MREQCQVCDRHSTDSDAGCLQIANLIRGKTPQEVREIFNIEDDFSEEEKVRVLLSMYGAPLALTD